MKFHYTVCFFLSSNSKVGGIIQSRGISRTIFMMMIMEIKTQMTSCIYIIYKNPMQVTVK